MPQAVKEHGSLLFVQPRGEYLRQKAVGVVMSGLFFAVGVLFLSGTTSLAKLVAAAPFGISVLFGVLTFRQRPYKPFEDGIEPSAGRFVPYSEVREAQELRGRTRSRFLLLPYSDGRLSVIGTPMTRNVRLSTRAFDHVSELANKACSSVGIVQTSSGIPLSCVASHPGNSAALCSDASRRRPENEASHRWTRRSSRR